MTTASNTLNQYENIIHSCRDLYLKKAADYGTSWRVLRPVSIVDQIYIKAWRIRQIQENTVQLIEDSVESEFIGIVNYGIIALIQQQLGADEQIDLSVEEARTYYDLHANAVKELMLKKNHDYGEAWRAMSQASFVDLILVKLLRIRQIIANDGRVQVSEGADANFADIVNYALFALIRIGEERNN
ncbi:DUF1599 domain-containing protein [Rurimicrobium arvi]|uniref:DUF1599 domain-containing protein n=1 Tax=Rurimicrobium arvi TaxID=2049916 RepID=A0ABP8MZG4_9BACT